MAKAISITQAEDKVKQTLNTLQQAHSKWNVQQRITDNMLYVWIEECVGFYRFIKSDERYETAFKNVCGVTFRHKTSLSNRKGEISILQWLSENGGVNGVIRDGTSDTKAEKQHLMNVANDFGKFYIERNLTTVKLSDYLLNYKELVDEQMVILVGQVKAKDNKLHIHTFGSSNERIVNDVLADVGKEITYTAEYQRNAVKVTKALEEMDAKAIEEVGKEMDKIQKKMRAEEAKEKAKEAA